MTKTNAERAERAEAALRKIQAVQVNGNSDPDAMADALDEIAAVVSEALGTAELREAADAQCATNHAREDKLRDQIANGQDIDEVESE